jgi:Cu(I)/Ag(I) efflux system membrane fusion protein
MFTSPYIRYTSILLTGILVGALLFGSFSRTVDDHAGHNHEAGEAGEDTVWTCSMHPQIRQSEPGTCPICAMALIPAASGGSEDAFTLIMTNEAVRLSEINTSVARKIIPSKVVRLNGRVVPAETHTSVVSASFGGRITSQDVNFTGARVQAGQVLATIWSPELITAQQELLDALAMMDRYPETVEFARQKLRFWNISNAQITAIEDRGTILSEFPILAPRSGIVIARNVKPGDLVQQGTVLYEVADLSRVWLEFEAYEQDLSWIRLGQTVRYQAISRPGEEFGGVVNWIDPVLNPERRTVKIRVEIANQGGTWRPDMLVTGQIRSDALSSNEVIVIPATAVLWTGPRSIVYVSVPDAEVPTFESREVLLGERTGDFWIIRSGLSEGEAVVTNGAFKIDAEFQLRDKFSMMNREPGSGATAQGHQHGALQSAPSTTRQGDVIRLDGNVMTSQRAFSNDAFRNKLDEILAAYFDGKDALIESNPELSGNHATKLYQQIESARFQSLGGDASGIWLAYRDDLLKEVDIWRKTRELTIQRNQLHKSSTILYEVAQRFGVKNLVYQQYCPMAFNDEGATWLSSSEEIQNPYLPDTMLGCGELLTRIR